MAADPPRPDAPPPSADPASPPPSSATDPDAADAQPAAAAAKDSEAVEMGTFSQILELDDDDGTYEFSKEMVSAYFSQAGTTFGNMDKALTAKNLPELGALGHFLKGSSAALGIHKVQAACEKMQHYGDLRDEQANEDLTPEDALERIKVLIVEVKAEYKEAEGWLRKWYKEKGVELESGGVELDDGKEEEGQGKGKEGGKGKVGKKP